MKNKNPSLQQVAFIRPKMVQKFPKSDQKIKRKNLKNGTFNSQFFNSKFNFLTKSNFFYF